MKASFLILITLTTLIGCSNKNTDMPTAVNQVSGSQTTLAPGTYSYLALGDSYTIGESVSQSGSFPYQLQKQLGAAGFSVSAPKIIAVTGWTTANLINAIAQANIASQRYSFVTLLIGVNNQYQGLSQTTYRAEFVQLLNTAITLAGGDKLKVFVISIPDYSVTPFAASYDKVKISTEIDQFNAINKEESAKAGVNYTNITDISRQVSIDASLVAYDGLHPSEKMYGLWVGRLTPIVAAQLK
jgi:lysophospholipase L1-like esterase